MLAHAIPYAVNVSFHLRATQAEYFDDPSRSQAEVIEGYRWLNRVNRLLLACDPFQRDVPQLLGAEDCRAATFLDLGAGDGTLGRELAVWAARRAWRWSFTYLDLNPLAFPNGADSHHVVGSVLALPFPDNAFDVVIASLMTHHLASDETVRQHFREAWRVCRKAVVIVDCHRNCFAYAAMACLLRALGCPPGFREDGLLSIRRGWRVGEWRRLATEAGLTTANVRLYFGSKVILSARKQGAGDPVGSPASGALGA